ncbi:glycine betaine ABC transporter substrate-binding protein [Ornithinibacillus sp. 4-3]|uniref:Glycine betaine ABC transporter substrate-binding protein n=1 Tax=Ornithinibacillus sp. 4-3 TaxID=3231488 RepID=A0AB39HTY3_9BACI
MIIMKRSFILVFLFIFLSGCSVLGGGSKSITIGGKNFTEQYILTQMTYYLLEEEGFQVRMMENLGSTLLRVALENGQVTLAWDYTGTILVSHLGQEPISDPDEAFEELKRIDKANGIDWVNPSGVNNTFAFVMTQEQAEELEIETMSDLADYINENPNELTLGTDAQFTNRPEDGLPGVEEEYGFSFGVENTVLMEPGLVYGALQNGDLDVAVAYETNSQIEGYDLFLLEDDKSFFPPYHAALAIDEELFEQYPEIETILAPLAESLDSEVMRKLNYQVDFERQSVALVAHNYLVENGFLEE